MTFAVPMPDPTSIVLKRYKKNRKDGTPSQMLLDPKSLNQALKMPYELKELESYRMVREHLDVAKKPHVATSWGNDSTVMSHMVIRACKELGISKHSEQFPHFILNNTLNIYKEEQAYWKTIVDFLDIPDDKFTILKPNKLDNGKQATMISIAEQFGLPAFRRSSRSGLPHHMRDEPKCCQILKKEPVNAFWISMPPESIRFDLSFVGVRAEESQNRRLDILLHCRTNVSGWQRPYPIRTVKPLGFFTLKDIYRYFLENNIPKNPAYTIHNQTRLGCAMCTGHMGWEKRLVNDPTNDGDQMLLKIMQILKSQQINRYWNSLYRIRQSGKKEHLIQKIMSIQVLDEFVKGGKEYKIWDEELTPEGKLMKENSALELFM